GHHHAALRRPHERPAVSGQRPGAGRPVRRIRLAAVPPVQRRVGASPVPLFHPVPGAVVRCLAAGSLGWPACLTLGELATCPCSIFRAVRCCAARRQSGSLACWPPAPTRRPASRATTSRAP